MNYTYTLMTKFINIKYYTYDQTINMLDVYMGFGRISVEQYAELSMLANDVYQHNVDNAFTKEDLGNSNTESDTTPDASGDETVTTLPADDQVSA